MPSDRRKFLQTAGMAGALGLAGCTGGISGGSGGTPDEVTFGTLTPLSGPFALDGRLVKQGVDFAAQEINNNGGIEALDGAKINVVSEDTGETTDSATSAAQDLYSNESPAATFGSWLSSQTIATTAVSEREGVPQLTLSYSDEIVNRGFKYVFKTAPLSSEFAKQILDLSIRLSKAVGSGVSKVALVGDNTASTASTYKPLRNEIIPNKKGVSIAVDEVWSPTLSDATPVVRELKNNQPDVMFFGATAFPDSIAILRKMNELGVQLPTIGIGAWLTLPSYVKNVGPKLTEGIMAGTGGHPLKGQQGLIRRFSKFSGEPFMIQDSIIGYANTWLAKEAIEQASSATPEDVRNTLADINLSKGTAVKSLPVKRIQFQKNGQMRNSTPILTQWADRGNANFIGTQAAPFTVFPEDLAMRKVNWTPAKYS